MFCLALTNIKGGSAGLCTISLTTGAFDDMDQWSFSILALPHGLKLHEMNAGNSGYLTNRLVRETPEDRRRTYAGTRHSVVSLHSFCQMMLPNLFITTHNGASIP